MVSGRFDRFLPLAGLLFLVGLVLNRIDPSSDSDVVAANPST
jgi:hypothetical protein